MDMETYWKKFQQQYGTDKIYNEAYHFCNNKEDADELAELVFLGKKQATASNYSIYEYEDEEIPKVGNLNIVTDFDGNPVCVVETTSVEIIPFKDVTPEFAAKEGEGDLSLEYWREGHKKFFSLELKEIGLSFSDDMLVVCESFRVVFK